MAHGIDSYFHERERFRKRLAAAMLWVGAFYLVLHFSIASVTLYHQSDLRRLAERWGYEGPEQYARRIVLQSESGPRAPALEVSTTDAASSRRGGDPVKSSGEGQPIPRVRRTTIDREGDADLDRLASVRAQLLNVPLVQSENLIIEKLVRPVYPELAQEQGIEGRVAVLALVDTLGRIHEVETVGASEDQLLMAAAEIAVKKCRFRPYKVDGRKQAVYAMFKFSFKLE